jgi:heme-degrading monooxygenase HmoA
MNPVRVLVWHDAQGNAPALEQEYERISRRLAGTPGLVANELWHSAADPQRYAVASEWVSLEAFRAWADDPEQHRVTWSLRRYRPDNRDFGIYAVVTDVPRPNDDVRTRICRTPPSPTG